MSQSRGFLDPKLFDFIRMLEDGWGSIRAELESLAHTDFVQWPETYMYDSPEYNRQGWYVYGLHTTIHPQYRELCAANAARCPDTAEMLRRIPGLRKAGFSALLPQTYIGCHVGPPRGILRFHLGLYVPDGDCGFIVGGEKRRWEEGRCLVFDDTVEHEAWNLSEDLRIVLLFDVESPLATGPAPSNAGTARPE